jgi:Tol biopolymer transport system component
MGGQLKLWILLCFFGLWITHRIHAEDFELKVLSNGSTSGSLAFSVENQSPEKPTKDSPAFVSQVFIIRLRPGKPFDLPRDLQKVEGNFADSSYPSFSPDGRHLAFSAVKDGRRQIFIMDYPDGRVSQVTECEFKCENVAC